MGCLLSPHIVFPFFLLNPGLYSRGSGTYSVPLPEVVVWLWEEGEPVDYHPSVALLDRARVGEASWAE